MRDVFGASVFYIVNVLLLPITLLGYVIWVGKLLTVRASGVSGTAQGPLSARFFQHRLGIRDDDAAGRLLTALPNISPMGVRLFSAPMVLGHRVSGYVPRAFRYPFQGDVSPQYQASARVTFFDAAIERHLPAVHQFVILGAGFDTRAFRPPANGAVKCFEVDAPKTQAVKRAMLAKAGLDSTGVTFVAADFEEEDWLAKLVDAGLDSLKPALFLWEGVSMYLRREAVESTLRRIASTARGSVVAFDYITTMPLESGGLYWRLARAGTSAGGEPLKFGIDSTPPSRDGLAALLQSCGLTLVEQCTLGPETNGMRAWGGFAIASVDSAALILSPALRGSNTQVVVEPHQRTPDGIGG